MRRDRWQTFSRGPSPLPELEITDEVVQRYREVYSIPSDVAVTKEMVRYHADLEYELTQMLLNSRREERAIVWAASYDKLYRDLPWLAESSATGEQNASFEYKHLLSIIPAGSRVIEIGSGIGLLAQYLTANGRPCIATEITPERGLRDTEELTWHHTDGINLASFEPPNSYDAVVSMQVIEHFHPEDVEEHFRGAFALLRPGGRYIFTTPHAFLGPADLSKVFSLNRSYFMHLKEYTHRELGYIARRAGFRDIAAVWIPPSAVRKRLPVSLMLCSRLLYYYLAAMEIILGQARLPSVLLRVLLFRGDVYLVAIK